MHRWIGRTALVTGASSGIGASISKELVNHGMVVVGCARNVEKMRETSQEMTNKNSGRFYSFKCDLNDESGILSMFDNIRRQFGSIDVCINNAGFSYNSPLLSGKTNEWREMINVNILALCICARESVKLMRDKETDDGQIIHISSMGAHTLPPAGFPEFSFYCGTKFMVRALTDGLRKELKSLKSGIRVASISPGLVETEFLSRTYVAEPDRVRPIFEDFKSSLKPADIANAVTYILKAPPHVEVNDIIISPLGGTT